MAIMSGIACFGMLLTEMEPREIAKGWSAEAEAEAITHAWVVKVHEHFIFLGGGSIRKSLPMPTKCCQAQILGASIDNSVVCVDLAGSLPPDNRRTPFPIAIALRRNCSGFVKVTKLKDTSWIHTYVHTCNENNAREVR